MHSLPGPGALTWGDKDKGVGDSEKAEREGKMRLT